MTPIIDANCATFAKRGLAESRQQIERMARKRESANPRVGWVLGLLIAASACSPQWLYPPPSTQTCPRLCLGISLVVDYRQWSRYGPIMHEARRGHADRRVRVSPVPI